MGRKVTVSPEKRARQAVERQVRNEQRRLKALRASQGLIVQALCWPQDIQRTSAREREAGRFRIKSLDSVLDQLQKSAVRWTDYCTLSWAVHKDAPHQAFENNFIEPGVTIRFGRHVGTPEEIHQRIAVDHFQSPAANLRAAVNGFKGLEQMVKSRIGYWIDELSHAMSLYERTSKADMPLEHIDDALAILEIESINITRKELDAQRKRLHVEYHPEIWLDDSAKQINGAYQMVLVAQGIRDKTSELRIKLREKEKYLKDKHAANLRWRDQTAKELKDKGYKSQFSPFSVVGRKIDFVD